jgi:xanthine dehydrogenase accessory factor
VKELQDIFEQVEGASRPLALATLLRVEGSSYRKPGARLLTDGDQVLRGSLSGGCLEGEILARAQEVLKDGEPRLLRYDLRGDADLVWGTGMGCEGVLEVLVERVLPDARPEWMQWVQEAWTTRSTLRIGTALDPLGARRKAEADEDLQESFIPPPALWIVGAELDQGCLVWMARALGWRVGMLDHRPALATRARFPEAHDVRCGRPRAWVSEIPWDVRTAVVLMTHNYALDLEAMRGLMTSPVGYIGLMGSRERCERLRAELKAEDLDFDARVHAPVGLDLGAQTPESIALAILAEIQMRLEGGTGRSLSRS